MVVLRHKYMLFVEKEDRVLCTVCHMVGMQIVHVLEDALCYGHPPCTRSYKAD